MWVCALLDTRKSTLQSGLLSHVDSLLFNEVWTPIKVFLWLGHLQCVVSLMSYKQGLAVALENTVSLQARNQTKLFTSLFISAVGHGAVC